MDKLSAEGLMLAATNRPALVVHDVGTITMLIAQSLRVLGFSEVDRVGDVESALKQLHSMRYGLVLSAIHMEPLDGFALLQKVRCDPATSSLPFIFISGEKSADFVERARRAGATGCLVKTSGPYELVESIRYALNAPPGAAFCVPCRLPSLETAETVIFGTEVEPVH